MEVKSISKIIGANYNEFWHYRGRYRVVKGGRGSKKSTTTAIWFIYHLLKHPKANALCVRAFYKDLKDSCYSELRKACIRLGVIDKFKFTVSPLEITVKATGQKILFRGFDKAESVTSITVSEGCLCWVWVEEAFQIDDEDDFNKLDFSIRGKDIADYGLFPQITLTMNPWAEMWIKDRFFDKPSADVMTMTRNYFHNEFLSKDDYRLFNELKEENPERYKVEGLGEWGMPGGRYFSEWREGIHVCEPFEIPAYYRRYVAFDYGLDMFACYFIALSERNEAYVYKEIHRSGLIVSEAIEALKEATEPEEHIYSYIAPPDMWNKRQETGKSIADWFSDYGIGLERASNERIQSWLNMKEWLKVYKDEQGIETAKLKIFRNCTNLIRCMPRLAMDEKRPNDVAKEPHEITHAPDALRYFIASQPVPERPHKAMPVFNFEFEKRRFFNENFEKESVPI